jgi:hypothetical protein
MYQLYATGSSLNWTFYGPIAGMVVLILLGVPIWVVLGLGTAMLLSLTDVLPLTLVGETLFSGIDSFSLIAVPLFILTGDVIVTTRLSEKLLDLAEATMGWLRSALGTSTILGCGFFSAKGISVAVRFCARGEWRDHGYSDSTVDCLHHHRADTWNFRFDPVPCRGHSRGAGAWHYHRDQCGRKPGAWL